MGVESVNYTNRFKMIWSLKGKLGEIKKILTWIEKFYLDF